LILVQHQYNNCTTTPHMKVGPSMWDPPSCEGLLYSCCIGVVNLTFSFKKKKKIVPQACKINTKLNLRNMNG